MKVIRIKQEDNKKPWLVLEEPPSRHTSLDKALNCIRRTRLAPLSGIEEIIITVKYKEVT